MDAEKFEIMCERCGVREDEVLVETVKDGETIKIERLCEECHQKDLIEEGT